VGTEAWTDPWARLETEVIESLCTSSTFPIYLSIHYLSINHLYHFWTRTPCPSFLTDETVPQFFELNEVGRGFQEKDSSKSSSTLYFLILTMPCFAGPDVGGTCQWDSSQHPRDSVEKILHRGAMNHRGFLSRDIQATVQMEKNV